MDIWANSVVTHKGLALQAKLIAGTKLTITRAVAGTGYVTPGLLQQQTAVGGVKQELTFSAVSYPEEGKCALGCRLTNDGLPTGYTAMQVGVYATDPDEGEILYFITQSESNKGTEVPSETEAPGFSAEWNFYFQFGQADGVTVVVNPSNTVSPADFEAHKKATNPHDITPEAINALSQNAQSLSSGANLDGCNDIGMYTGAASASAEITNVPEKSQGTMMTLPRMLTNSVVNRVQIVFTQNNNIYVRNKIDDVWNGWRKMYKDDDIIPVKNGGTGASDITNARNNLSVTPWTLSYADTFEEFWDAICTTAGNMGMVAFRAKDTGGWGPTAAANTWLNGIAYWQNPHTSSDDVNGTIILRLHSTSNTALYKGIVTGNKASGYTLVWHKLYDTNNKPTLEEIGALRNCSNTDFNNLKTVGCYFGYTNMTNAAFQDISVLEVIPYSSDWVLQRQTRLTDGKTFCRYFSNGSKWSDWHSVLTTLHKPTPADIAAGTFSGYVAANKSGQHYGTGLLRNTKLVSADTNPTVDGEINWTYK